MKLLLFPNEMRSNSYYQTFRGGLRAAGIEDVRLSSVLRLRSGFDAVHLHHPEHVVTQGGPLKATALSVALLSVLLYARLTGRPVVRMMHDVEPAYVRRKLFLTGFLKIIGRLTSAHVFLNRSSQKLFNRRNPGEAGKPFCFAPHSRFETKMFGEAMVTNHRRAQGIAEDGILISFLGSITAHKGLECAALVPGKTKSGHDVTIAVCGLIDDALPRNYVDNVLRHRPDQLYIRIADRLTDEALALWIQSSDAVVLPYRTGSNSGMALNVLSNHGRIISSELPMFKELAETYGPAWIRCVDVGDAVAVREAIDALPLWMRQKPDHESLDAALAKGDPVENGHRLRVFYLGLRQKHREAVAS